MHRNLDDAKSHIKEVTALIRKLALLIRYLYTRAVRIYYDVRYWVTGKRSFEE